MINVGCAASAAPSHKLWDSRPKQRSEQKTDTMKTYVLKAFPPVEPQTQLKKQPQNQAPGTQPSPASQAPATPAPNPLAPPPALCLQAPTSLADVSWRGSQPTPLTLFIGLDVHNDSIAVSIAPSDSTEVRRYGIIGGSLEDVLINVNGSVPHMRMFLI